MLVPPILGLDEWETIAMPMQAKLMSECDRDASRSVGEPDRVHQ